MKFENYAGSNIIGVELNDWKIHNLNLLEILSQMNRVGAKVSYLNLSESLFPEFGTLYGGRKDFSAEGSYSSTLISILKRDYDVIIQDLSFNQIKLSRKNTAYFYRDSQSHQLQTTMMMDLSYKGFNYGNSVMSTIYSDFRSDRLPNPLLQSEFSRISSLWVQLFDFFESFFVTNSFDTLVIFNGRFFGENAAISAAKSLNMKILYHESSGRPQSYNVDTFSPLSLAGASEVFGIIRNEIEYAQIEHIGQKWFQDRQTGASPELMRIQKTWVKDYVGFPSGIKIATFFTTSDDEFLGLGKEWNFGSHKTQINAARSALKILKEAGYFTIVRIHPNTVNKATRMTKQWLNLEYVDQVFLPLSNVDSYDLIQKSDLVVVAGSTIGIEAAYLGVKSASVGSAIYEGMNALLDLRGVHDVGSFEKKLDGYDFVKARFAALVYGYWESKRTILRTIIVQEKNSVFSEEYTETIVRKAYFFLKRRTFKLFIRFFSLFLHSLKKLNLNLSHSNMS
jgi:hypothetical protein